jgi:hypothetical protein
VDVRKVPEAYGPIMPPNEGSIQRLRMCTF